MSGSKDYGTFTQRNSMQQKDGAHTPWDSMEGTGQHCAKWNKLGSEGQIPSDLTFNWNIINRRKKQTKYNQRHWS